MRNDRILVLLAGLTLALSLASLAGALKLRSEAEPLSRLASEPSARLQSGTELVAVFITSSACPASHEPSIREAIPEARTALEARAARLGVQFAFVGVALDLDPVAGLRFLSDFGPFDEVMSGGGWLSTGSVHFLVTSAGGELSTPQLLVLERDIIVEETKLTVSNHRLIATHVGFDEILNAHRTL